MNNTKVGRISNTWNEWLWGWFLVAPTVIGLIILNIIPIFQTMYMSFFESGDFGKGNIFVGFDNYRKLLSDDQVWHAVKNTLLYAVMVVPTSIVLALIAAVLMNGKLKGKSLYRTIYFIPMIAAPAAVTMVWKWLYNTRFGLINYGLAKLGIGSVDWTTNSSVALVSIAIIGVWSVVGYNMVLLLAGLQEIPKDYYEAAEIDGAGTLH